MEIEDINTETYKAQRISLKKTQKTAKGLENLARKILSDSGIEFKSGNVRYDDINPLAVIQADIAIPNCEDPETIISITHTNPDKPGHSNENKLYQKIGELYLWKTYNPDLRIVLVMGWRKESWLPYVEKVFRLFFDDVVVTWDDNFKSSLIRSLSCELKNKDFWQDKKRLRDEINLWDDENLAPISKLRINFYNKIIKKYLGVKSPREISNPMLRLMAETAYNKEGKFWVYLSEGKYKKIWEERSYFNPMEATVQILLDSKNFKYEGKLGTDVEIKHNLLHNYGIEETKISEDFVLYSTRYNCKVHIQCKASSGGIDLHTKALPSRAREQIARSIFMRCEYDRENEKLKSKPKNFKQIYILDGNWRSPKKYPLKYIHILQIAGADRIFSASELVDDDLNPNYGCVFLKYLEEELNCEKITQKTIYDFSD